MRGGVTWNNVNFWLVEAAADFFFYGRPLLVNYTGQEHQPEWGKREGGQAGEGCWGCIEFKCN